MTPTRDTAPAAEAAQLLAQRRLGGAGRMRLAFEMSVLTRELAMARLRQAHPEWSPTEVRRELLRYSFLPNPLPQPLQ